MATTTPTEEEEENNDNIINTRGRVAVAMVVEKKRKEEEEREKKEDFVKAVDDLLELVTKKFSRISRDMLGKSTSIYHPFFLKFFFFKIFLFPGREGEFGWGAGFFCLFSLLPLFLFP